MGCDFHGLKVWSEKDKKVLGQAGGAGIEKHANSLVRAPLPRFYQAGYLTTCRYSLTL